MGLKAADDDKDKGPVPEEIPDFSRLDEYIYVPKSTLSMGSRFMLAGPKATYSGQGAIPQSVGTLSSPNIPNVSRTYNDGQVLPDARTINNSTGLGSVYQEPVASDGRTNSWSYDYNNQLQPNGDIAFHVYSGEVTDTGSYAGSTKPTEGLELLLDRDMGKIGSKLKWSLVVGFSIANINSSVYANVATTQTTVTDTYDLFGQVPPSAPFSSPNNVSQTVLNSSGQAVSSSGSATTSQEATQTILIGDKPLSETVTNTAITTTNRYYVLGAYYTLRGGPNLIIPFTQKLHLTASIGPELVFSGTTLNVLEDLVAATGETTLTQLYQKENNRLMPGIYADLDLRYDLTDTAGLYLGGIYERSGSYTQAVESGPDTAYTTKLDFQSEQGVKGGLTVRF